MGDSQARLGPTLGRVHAWRDRGAIYVDGVRTSLQAAFLGAGVAKGADFLALGPAVWFGLGIFLALEGAKIGLGALDYRFDIVRNQQQIMSEQNPVTMRQVAALEKLAG